MEEPILTPQIFRRMDRRLLISLALAAAIVIPLLIIGRASAVSLDIDCDTSANQATCVLTLLFTDQERDQIGDIQFSITGPGPTELQSTFDPFPDNGIGYGVDDELPGFGYGVVISSEQLVYRIVVDTTSLNPGEYTAAFEVNTGPQSDPSFGPVSDSFSISPGVPPADASLPANALVAVLNSVGTRTGRFQLKLYSGESPLKAATAARVSAAAATREAETAGTLAPSPTAAPGLQAAAAAPPSPIAGVEPTPTPEPPPTEIAAGLAPSTPVSPDTPAPEASADETGFPVSAIIGIVLGVVAVLAAVVIMYFVRRRRISQTA